MATRKSKAEPVLPLCLEPPCHAIAKASQKLSKSLNKLDCSSVVPWVYNPYDYAWDCYWEYLERFANSTKQVLYLGMNPGPWGMVQTGIPFGEVAAVRDWIGIRTSAKKPKKEHPKRPIDGLACTKSEVSGRRLWSLFRERYGTPEAFFATNFVANYCPLAFMSETAANITPDKLPANLRNELQEHCDRHLVSLIDAIAPEWIIGIGGFAEECAKRCIGDRKIEVGRILHPSPASPAANRGWDKLATSQLRELGVW